MDGVIMFSDILTPLPAMGIEFDVIKGTGPRIDDPVRTPERCAEIAARVARGDFAPEENLAFTGETLQPPSIVNEGHGDGHCSSKEIRSDGSGRARGTC